MPGDTRPITYQITAHRTHSVVNIWKMKQIFKVMKWRKGPPGLEHHGRRDMTKVPRARARARAAGPGPRPGRGKILLAGHRATTGLATPRSTCTTWGTSTPPSCN